MCQPNFRQTCYIAIEKVPGKRWGHLRHPDGPNKRRRVIFANPAEAMPSLREAQELFGNAALELTEHTRGGLRPNFVLRPATRGPLDPVPTVVRIMNNLRY